ncbi:MAG: DUF2061 domain-containing protein [Alphaproteobacteria bacterium]
MPKIKFPTIAKTATYSVIHMVIAFCAAWVVSRDLKVALGISMVEPAFQIFGFFLHEKAWDKWGKNHPSFDEETWHAHVGHGCHIATALESSKINKINEETKKQG